MMGQGMGMMGMMTGTVNDENSILRIFHLKYGRVEDIINTVSYLFANQLMMTADSRTNSLIVRGNEQNLAQFVELLQSLDVDAPKPPEEARSTSNIAYRVIAVEKPIPQTAWLNFDLNLICTAKESSTAGFPSQFTSQINQEGKVHINRQNVQKHEGNSFVITISGAYRDASLPNNSLLDYLLPQFQKMGKYDIQVTNFSWNEDKTNPPSSGLEDIQIPENIRPVLARLLGKEYNVAGYWFGNSAFPGNCEAPLGLWNLRLESNVIPGKDQFALRITVGEKSRRRVTSSALSVPSPMTSDNTQYPSENSTAENPKPEDPLLAPVPPSQNTARISLPANAGERRFRGGSSTGYSYTYASSPGSYGSGSYGSFESGDMSMILSNSVNGELGKPIIIGYNRTVSGTPLYGALIIIPQAEF